MKSPTILFVSALLCAACGDSNTQNEPGPDLGDQVCEPAPPTAAAVEPLQWIGLEPLLNNLGRALELPTDELCTELGTIPCKKLYRITLGASDPFGAVLYEPIDMPLATTPLAVERVILSACIGRVERDADPAASARVFTRIDLAAAALDPASTEVAEQVAELYRRLLSREPGDDELAAVAGLAAPIDGQDVSARDFAVTACFAIATTTDFLFI